MPLKEREKGFYQLINGADHRPIVGSASNISSTIRVPEIAPFVVVMTMQRVNTNTTGAVQFVATGNFNAPELLVYWRDTVKKMWFNSENSADGMPLDSVYGDGRLPHYLARKIAFAPGTWEVILRNLSASDRYVFLTHEGYFDEMNKSDQAA